MITAPKYPEPALKTGCLLNVHRISIPFSKYKDDTQFSRSNMSGTLANFYGVYFG